ncbi:PREDICTED: uncharacterized protein LOC105562434 [Vollenhovia emeryi]|uniref:uncharacterized protein LOC105562434 n=1 Tax=Vollenhovia emeryi TaxID=411798 RepID=UPI0005F42B3A|nr:PREDICTED: uncharacterized protein LOC105562434 [Vollenhovia emeryi]
MPRRSFSVPAQFVGSNPQTNGEGSDNDDGGVVNTRAADRSFDSQAGEWEFVCKSGKDSPTSPWTTKAEQRRLQLAIGNDRWETIDRDGPSRSRFAKLLHLSLM